MSASHERRAAIATLGVAAVLFCASAVDPGGLRKWRRLSHEARRIEAENHDLARENERLRREVHALRFDPAAIERAVREDLGYTREGELILKLDEEPGP
jgi:cell division protein FtsB